MIPSPSFAVKDISGVDGKE
ncbi:hypothetical protein A2U01_0082258, partial [Trifolium medium]|nr:hypothetical protein [Trifolium medium]